MRKFRVILITFINTFGYIADDYTSTIFERWTLICILIGRSSAGVCTGAQSLERPFDVIEARRRRLSAYPQPRRVVLERPGLDTLLTLSLSPTNPAASRFARANSHSPRPSLSGNKPWRFHPSESRSKLKTGWNIINFIELLPRKLKSFIFNRFSCTLKNHSKCSIKLCRIGAINYFWRWKRN